MLSALGLMKCFEKYGITRLQNFTLSASSSKETRWDLETQWDYAKPAKGLVLVMHHFHVVSGAFQIKLHILFCASLKLRLYFRR